MRTLTLVVSLFLLAPAAAAQEATPVAEIGGGYSVLQQDGDSMSGWVVSGSVTLARWFGIAAEFGSNYYSEDQTFWGQTYHYSSTTKFYGLGPRLVARTRSLSVFGQFLVGVEDQFSQNMFSIQAGGGADIWLTRTIGARVGFDGRASSYDEETYGSWRFQTGIVFALGSR